MEAKVSILIPTKDRPDSLRRCVASVLSGNRKPDEILIIDDGERKTAAESLAGFTDTRIRVIAPQRPLGKSGARNEGIRQSKGDILAFIDDDCVAEQSWLQELVKPFDDAAIDFSIGQTFYVHEKYHAHYPERIVSNIAAKYPMTGNIAFRKRVFDTCGLFDASFDSIGKEDAEFGIRAVSKGCRFFRSVNAVVNHEKSVWTVRGLFSSIKNSSVWPLMKSRYPNHFRVFDPPVIWRIVQPVEYGYLIFFPVLIIPLFLMYLKRGNRNIGLFFAKWPLFFILKRLAIWRESIRYKTLLL